MRKEEVRLGDICDIKSSKRIYQNEYTDKRVHFYRGKEISELSRGNNPQIELYINRERYDELKDKFGAPKKGDLLITSVGTIGNTWVSDGREFYYKDGNITQIVDNNNINTNYISYLFASEIVKKQYQCSGTAQAALTIEKLKKITVPIPSIEIQQKIATILDNAQSIIDKRKEQIEACDELVKSLFYEMFGEIKKNKKNYQIKKLEDITNKITDGVHSKPNYTTDGIPFISVKDINTSKIIFNNCKYISQEDHESYCKRCKPERGDLLYTKVGATYGIPAVVDTDKEFSLYVSVALIKPNKDEVNSIYLRESLRSICIKRQADNAIKGIGVPDLHLIEIKKFQIILPPLSLQNKFAAQVEKIEQQKNLLEQSLKELENNFNSLMQRAFKGELF